MHCASAACIACNLPIAATPICLQLAENQFTGTLPQEWGVCTVRCESNQDGYCTLR